VSFPIEVESKSAEFAKKFRASQFIEAAKVAAETVDLLKRALKASENASADDLNEIYLRAIFFRGLFDLCIIERVMEQENWDQDHALLDYVWTKYWDCKDRFDFSRPLFGGALVEHIDRTLQRLSNYYLERFGPGRYMSADLMIKTRLCSVCREDLRGCDHVPGRLYGGILCRGIPVGIEPVGASLVENPKDPRCRIWPWDFDSEKGIIKATILTVHELDDFIGNDGWVNETPNIRVGVKLSNPDFLKEFYAAVTHNNKAP
jgi:hypothetical protein